MKPIYTILPDFATKPKPFFAKEIVRPAFISDFHYHQECQLVYIISGSGTRIVGNAMERYEKGELIFVGSNVPHAWYSDKLTQLDQEPDHSITLYINPSLSLELFKEFIDINPLNSFFIQSERCIKILGNKKQEVIELLQTMAQQNDSILLASLFLKIMSLLCNEDDFVWLHKESSDNVFLGKTQKRVEKLMLYIKQNYQSEISLEEAANVADMQLHSFCRFFKNLTNRTFSDFVNQLRIEHACKLLKQSDFPITNIAYECGYDNISYFNRTFKKNLGTTPKEFRMSEQLILPTF